VSVQHQAQGLQQLFSGHAARVVSVLAGPSAPASHEFVLALAAELTGQAQRVWLVERDAVVLSQALGCRPLLSWRASQPLEQQVIRAGAYGLIRAPGCMAGDPALANAARESRGCDCLLFDGGRFSPDEAALAPGSDQTVIVLLGNRDAEAGYALLKALKAANSPAHVLLMGEVADSVSQTLEHFMAQTAENRQTAGGLCQIDNKAPETSSNTLTIAPNLTWVVSRIMQNDQPKVAHGGCGKSAEEVYER
jgi:hypothetical protein